MQNLALGLRYRHYIPAYLGQKNRFDVADKPVWLEVGVCVVCFIFFGTSEETYLALYAAGVFVLLSLTGWAAVKRLGRKLLAAPTLGGGLGLAGTLVAVLLTSAATLIIFEDRLREGAWMYFVLIPVLYLVFDVFRRRLGPPTAIEDRLGQVMASSYLPSVCARTTHPRPAHQRSCRARRLAVGA